MDPSVPLALASLAAGAGALLAVLFAPLDVDLGVEHDEGTRGFAHVTWLFGLVHARLVKPDPDAPKVPEREPSEPDEEPDEEPLTEATVRERVRPVRALVETPGFLVAVRDLLTAWARAFGFRHLSLSARFGTGDPAETGRMFGNLQIAMPPVYVLPELEAEVYPAFYEEVVEGRLEVGLETTLASLAGPLARFLLAPPTLDAAHAAWEVRPDA